MIINLILCQITYIIFVTDHIYALILFSMCNTLLPVGKQDKTNLSYMSVCVFLPHFVCVHVWRQMPEIARMQDTPEMQI